MIRLASLGRHIVAFVSLTRPVFLLGGAQMFALGAVLAARQAVAVTAGTYLIGQGLVTSVQLATQYANEHYDQDADRDVGSARTWFSGGSGVLASGLLPPRTALVCAMVCSIGAVALVALVATRSLGAAAVGLVALAAGWGYSAPPARLVGRWGGVAAASLVVAVLVPLTALLVFTADIDARSIAIVVPLALLHAAMLLVFEAPDSATDAAAGKRTVTVRLGRVRAARLHGACVASAYLAVAVAVTLRSLDPATAGAMLLPVPLALWQVVGLRRRAPDPTARFGWLTVGAVALFSASATAALIATLLVT